MNAYGFLMVFRWLLALGGITLAGLGVCIATIWGELSELASFRRRFGTDWEAEYEKLIGPVSTAHTRITLCALGIVAILGLTIWLFRSLSGKPAKASSRKRQRRRETSHVERVVRYRRNALLGNYFGLAGILAGVALVLVDWGMFRDHDDEMSLGIFVFLAGYSGVITACWWWLKAKGWTEAVVFIGVLPIAILFIPFVRLIFVAAPLLLPVSMVMMPLILLTVVFALPDQSGAPRRQASWKNISQKEDR